MAKTFVLYPPAKGTGEEEEEFLPSFKTAKTHKGQLQLVYIQMLKSEEKNFWAKIYGLVTIPKRDAERQKSVAKNVVVVFPCFLHFLNSEVTNPFIFL